MRNAELYRCLSLVIESLIARKATQVQRWREDHITLSWLEALTDNEVFKRPAFGSLNVELAAWKLSGREESLCGDVAVIARIRYPVTSTFYQGAAFLEAKRSDPESPFRYSHFNHDQYRRVAKWPAHRYLFYRRRPFAGSMANAGDHPEELESPEERLLAALFGDRVRERTEKLDAEDQRCSDLAYSSAVPSYLLTCFPPPLADGVFSAGIPLAAQIHRYCHGWDLEAALPDQPVLIPADVPFVLTASVAHAGAEMPASPRLPKGYERIRSGLNFTPRGGGMSLG